MAAERRARRASLIEAGVAVALCLLASALFAAPAWGTTITIQPSSADSSLWEGSANRNNGSDTTMQVQSQSGARDRRVVVQFSLSAIPFGSSITSAQLELCMTTAPAASRIDDVHRVTRSWTETGVNPHFLCLTLGRP